MSPAANISSRWCPTPEQLMILEEMYRAGIRTPSASQIQHVTSHLSLYGKIEGKNVFYWFQNHKARDRQKLKRKLYKQLRQQHQQLNYHNQHQQLYQHNPHHFLGCNFESPTFNSLQQFSSSFNSLIGHLPLQGNGVVEDASNQLLNYKKLEIQDEKIEMSNSLMRMYGRDWMMMVGMNLSPPLPEEAAYSNILINRPLKTLQLFPVTSTNLKEESSTAMSKSLQACSSQINN